MNGTPERGQRCACGCPTCEYCTFGWNQPKCESHHRTGRGKYADEICSDCDHDECELWAEPYRGIGRTGDCDCADDFTCAEHGGGHVLRDHK